MNYKTIERVKQGLSNSSIGPETIALMLTAACNLDCLYCRGGRIDEKSRIIPSLSSELSTEELFSLFEDAKMFQVHEINIGGMDGEPFCKKDILSILEKVKSLGLVGSMTTNGSFLNSGTAKFLVDIGWDILFLSFDAADPVIQHTLRPARNKEPYFQNIVQFLETLNAKDSKLRVLLNVVISKLNYRELPRLLDFVRTYKNIDSVNILKMLNMGLVHYEDMQLNAEELAEFKLILRGLRGEEKLKFLGNWLDEQEASSQGTGASNKEQLMPKTPGIKRCYTNYYVLSIEANGDIVKCPQYPISVEGLNIKKKPLRELWKNEHLHFRQALAQDASCFEKCCTILKEQNRAVYSSISP